VSLTGKKATGIDNITKAEYEANLNIIDADIKGFFNNMEHERIIELIRFRISDPNILWLIKKSLTAGVVELLDISGTLFLP
jgi:retron-type reverse transcriptase